MSSAPHIPRYEPGQLRGPALDDAALRARSGDEAALGDVFRSVMGIVMSITSSYVFRHAQTRVRWFEDLQQDLAADVMTHIRTFDPEKGAAFSTHVFNCLRLRVRTFWIAYASPAGIRVPVPAFEARSEGKYAQHRDRALLPVIEIGTYDTQRSAMAEGVCFEEPRSREPDPASITDHMAVGAALETLSPRTRRVLEARFGLSPEGGEKTLEELAKSMRVSREWVRQIELAGLRDLAAALGTVDAAEEKHGEAPVRRRTPRPFRTPAESGSAFVSFL